jgi:hypothetical protein
MPAADRFGIVRAAGELTGVDEPETAAAVATMAPPTRWQPPPPATTWQPPAESRTGELGAWGWGSTGMTVIAAILLGGVV